MGIREMALTVLIVFLIIVPYVLPVGVMYFWFTKPDRERLDKLESELLEMKKRIEG